MTDSAANDQEFHDRMLSLGLARVSEAAAIASARLVGRGNEKAADQAAVNAMRDQLNLLDIKGVGKLMELAIGWGRETRPDMKVGICGEHGGHPASIQFCHAIGLSYVSCSGPRVPVARLAAAHAALLEQDA